MQGYTQKVYQKQATIYETPLIQSLQQELRLQNSFCLTSNRKQYSIQCSRGLPLTYTKQKCKNCQKLQSCINALTSQLLNIQNNFLQKEAKLNHILTQKMEAIDVLQMALENAGAKEPLNHLSSTFYTETNNLPKNHKYLSINLNQANQSDDSLLIKTGTVKYSHLSAYNLKVPPYKICQKALNKRQNQNIPPNSSKSANEKSTNKLLFENETLKDYNSALLAQLEKLKKGKIKKSICSFL